MSGKKNCCCSFIGSNSDVSVNSSRGSPAVVTLTYICSTFHCLMGVMSIVLGILSSRKAEVWMAHRVSPIWSGGFYLLTAITGMTTARRRTPYLVMCFGALCVVSMVVGVVCIQLLKLGLVTHLSDGATYKQEKLDFNVILALATSGFEILVCILSFPVGCQMAARVKKEVHMKRDGTFSIQVLGDKEIVIQQSDSASYERLYEDDTVSDLAKYALRGECSNLLLATAGLCSPSTQSAFNIKPSPHKKQRTTSSPNLKHDFPSVVSLTMRKDSRNEEAGEGEQQTVQSEVTESASSSKLLGADSDLEDISGLV